MKMQYYKATIGRYLAICTIESCLLLHNFYITTFAGQNHIEVDLNDSKNNFVIY